MKTNKLLKGINEDKILKDLTETLKQAIENAKKIRKEAAIREVKYRVALRDYAKQPLPGFKDLDELERTLDSRENRATLARKIVALDNLKRLPWRDDSVYREAAIQYYEYIIPILTDIENNKDEIVENMAEIKAEYERKMAEQRNKLEDCDRMITELFKVDEKHGGYNINKIYSLQFGYKIRSDYFARLSVENLKRENEVIK